jgi:hypothetical protein
MNDLQSAGAVALGFKPIVELAKSLLDVVGSGKGRKEAVELYGQIVAAQTAQTALIEEKRQLEAKLADREAEIRKRDNWEREKERYRLDHLCPDYKSVGYVLKDNAGAAEATHALCPQCFEDHKKRFLATEGRNMSGVENFKCSECGYVARVRRDVNYPKTLLERGGDGGPNSWMGH